MTTQMSGKSCGLTVPFHRNSYRAITPFTTLISIRFWVWISVNSYKSNYVCSINLTIVPKMPFMDLYPSWHITLARDSLNKAIIESCEITSLVKSGMVNPLSITQLSSSRSWYTQSPNYVHSQLEVISYGVKVYHLLLKITLVISSLRILAQPLWRDSSLT